MNRRRWIVLFVILAAVSGAIASLIWREALEQAIALPILQALYRAEHSLRSLDPEAIWVAFLTMAVALVLLQLPSHDRKKPPIVERPDALTQGRTSFWWSELRNLYRQSRYTRYSILELRKLVLDVVSFRQHCSLHQAEEWISDPYNQVHPAVIELFNPNMPVGSAMGYRDASTGWRRILGIRRMVPLHDGQNAARVEVILKFLEKEIKTGYDDPTL